MNSVLRISPGWTANTFFDLDMDSPIRNVIHDLYLKQLLSVFSWKRWMSLKGHRDEASRQTAIHESGIMRSAARACRPSPNFHHDGLHRSPSLHASRRDRRSFAFRPGWHHHEGVLA